MYKKGILGLFFGGLILTYHSCKHESLAPKSSQICSSDSVYYVNQIEPFLKTNCAFSGCHDAITQEDGVNLSSYYSFANDKDLVDREDPTKSELYEVLEKGEMPPAGYNVIPEDDIEMVLKWIAQGAKNNVCEMDTTTNVPVDTATSSTDTCFIEAPSFASDIWPTIQSKCNSCHNSGFPSGSIQLENYNDVKTIADNGKLVGVIDHEAGYPAMPQGQDKLDSCYIQNVKNWISNGAIDN